MVVKKFSWKPNDKQTGHKLYNRDEKACPRKDT